MQNKFAEARECFTTALHLAPSNENYPYHLAICEWQLGNRDVVPGLLHEAVRLNPQWAMPHSFLGKWHLMNGRADLALQASARAFELDPTHIDVIAERANVLEVAGRVDEAWKLAQMIVEDGQAISRIVLLYSRLAPRYGAQATAMSLLWKVLAQGNLPSTEAAGMHLALAALFEAAGRYDESFAQAVRGNSLRTSHYDPVDCENTFDRLIAYFTPERVRSFAPPAIHSDKPIFIVGMPRSGTSLVEQILASHPEIHGAGELDWIYRCNRHVMNLLSVGEEAYPQCLDSIPAGQVYELTHSYLTALTSLDPHAKRITDKMPLNFMHLGLIQLMIPGARVIHCRRNAMDNCVSCYMTHFAFGNDFKYDLGHLGHFYRQHERLMNHWKAVLNLPILDVNYEDMIADPQGQSRRLVEFAGVSWNDQCLNFHRTERPVITASTLQVRNPIYSSSVNRWRKFDNRLGTLKRSLGMG